MKIFSRKKTENSREIFFFNTRILSYEKKHSASYWKKIYDEKISKLQRTIDDINSIHNSKIINVWQKDTPNQGDINCAPCLYFPELRKNASYIDISHFPQSVEPRNKIIIVGGGGLFQEYFAKDMQKLYSLAEHNKLIIWGAGLDNYVGATSQLPQISNAFKVGVRDYENGIHPYVPCASCMSTLFDQFRNTPEIHHVKLYIHGDYSQPIVRDLHHLPCLSNRQASSYHEIIKFMSNAEIILTNSYHGMYWATLLGKKVIVLPWITKNNKIGFSEKFKTFKYQPVYCEKWLQYESYIKETTAYLQALNESRKANIEFFEDVKSVICK